MHVPPPLAPEQVDEALGDITWTIFHLAPPGWRRVRLTYREVGLHREVRARVELLDGSQVDWEVPSEVTTQLNRFRLGMRTDIGTWHSCALDVEFPGPGDPGVPRSFSVDWAGEPQFEDVCPVVEYRRELSEIYKNADYIQTWLVTRAALPDNPLAEHEWYASEEADAPAVCGGYDEGTQSDDVPEEILSALMSELPDDWATADYRVYALGGAQQHRLVGTTSVGTNFVRDVPADLIEAAEAVRTADYDPERGTWFTFRVRLAADSAATVTRGYDREPAWSAPIAADEYEAELQFFPRPDSAIPDWLRERCKLQDTSDKPEFWAPTLRQAEVFDSFDLNASAYFIDRPGLEPSEAEKVLAYLKAGALVLTARAVVRDELFRHVTPAVPLGFQTDGSWIWQQATVYYLERYRMPPQTALLEHIRAVGYRPPEIGWQAVATAREQLCEWIEGRVAT